MLSNLKNVIPDSKMKPLSTLAAIFAATAAMSHNVLLIAAATKEAETITIGSTVFEIDLGGGVTAGRVAVVLTSNAVAASGTLTLAENAVATNTVTIGSTVYTFVAAADAAGEVTIGADASETIDNLVAAIAGDDFNDAHPLVTAAAGAGDTMVVTAKIRGTGGNLIASTDTLAGSSAFGAATLANGADPSAANSITGIVAAINANMATVKAFAVTGGLMIVDSGGRGTIATTETLSGSGNAWQAATTYGLDAGGAIPNIAGIVQRAVNAGEASGKVMIFPFAETPVAYSLQVRASTGALKTWDGTSAIVGNAIVIYSGGSADLEENDVVAVTFAV